MEIIANTTVYFGKTPIALPLSNGHGPLNPSYVVIHSTANLGASALNHVNYWHNDDTYAVHYVGDWTGKVYHCVPDTRMCWQVGNGNPYVVGIELCEPVKATDFQKVWDVGVEWAAWCLNWYGWGVDRLLSHKDCSERWGGSDHTDPIPFFAKWGRTWEQFVSEVDAKLEGDEDMPSADEIAEAVWDYQIHGYEAGEREFLTNQQLFDRTDYSGRGKDGFTIVERVCWLADKCDKLQESIDALQMSVDALSGQLARK